MSITNRYLFLFLTSHGLFQSHLYQINKRNSPNYVCGAVSTSDHYILDCTPTSSYHFKKYPSQTLPEWFLDILEHTELIRNIIDCMQFLEKNEILFQDPLAPPLLLF